MDRYYVFQLDITVMNGGSWRQLFIVFPNETEVVLAICEALNVLTDALKEDPGQHRLLTNTYGNYSQLVKEQGLPDKPEAHTNGNTTRVCTYAGVTVGYIKAKVLGHACDTKGAQDDS